MSAISIASKACFGVWNICVLIVRAFLLVTVLVVNMIQFDSRIAKILMTLSHGELLKNLIC